MILGLLDAIKSLLSANGPDSNDKKSTDRKLNTEQFPVVGTKYYLRDINKLACRNPDWKMTARQANSAGKTGQKIFRYNYIHKPVKLIPEPKNPDDKHAVMVLIAGEKVGYISRDENQHVKEILSKREIKYISGFIGGGQYKIACSDGTFLRDEQDIRISVKIAYV